MIDLFKFRKKENKEEKLEDYNKYPSFEQSILSRNLEYNQPAYFHPTLQEKLNYPEPYVKPPFQNIYEDTKKFEETYFTSNRPEKHTDYSTDYSYDWESYIQGIVEDILKDKLTHVDTQLSEIKIWKEKLEIEISKINEKLKDIETRMNGMYEILAKKIDEYDKGIREATVEVEALHRLIRTMVPAISESTKELKETIEEIKQLRDQLKRV